MSDIEKLISFAVAQRASDLHLSVGSPPILRVDGKLIPIRGLEALTSHKTQELIFSILTDTQRRQFEENLELDFSFTATILHRVRVNIHRQRGMVEAAMRLVSSKIRTIQELHLPEAVSDLACRHNGLVLITGPTGVGKTTTLAAMVELINQEKEYLIVTIEDPIEYVHANKKSIVKQREVYSDTHSFAEALRRALRQDPNVIVVGEMRDLETIATALTAAETGHLVLATLHTPDASQTIDRIIDVFSPHQQAQIRIQLAGALQGIVSQLLCPRADGPGRIVATEVLIATPAVRNVIRQRETQQIQSLIQTGAAYKMQTMDKSLATLFGQGLINRSDALIYMKEPDRLSILAGRKTT